MADAMERIRLSMEERKQIAARIAAIKTISAREPHWRLDQTVQRLGRALDSTLPTERALAWVLSAGELLEEWHLRRIASGPAPVL